MMFEVDIEYPKLGNLNDFKHQRTFYSSSFHNTLTSIRPLFLYYNSQSPKSQISSLVSSFK